MSAQLLEEQQQTVAQALIGAVRRAARYNAEVETAPHCILWPDREQQWQSVIPQLQGEMPELLVLGGYDPERRSGPAIWLRCAIARVLDEVALSPDTTPVIYLPGVSRQDLRAVESCPQTLKPLAELQYRGVIWAQINGKDWTVNAFLKSDQGGLGLDVAQDQESKRAMLLALRDLIDQDVALLRDKRLDATYFNTLLAGGDPTRDLLQWLNDTEQFNAQRDEQEQAAFLEVCRKQFGFDPNDGPLVGASKLAERTGPWALVWQRYSESPQRYPNIPAQIRRCQTPEFDLLADADSAGGWPQWNDKQEDKLRHQLTSLADLPAHKARERLMKFDQEHAARSQLVWAELGQAPLACALEPLVTLAEITVKPLPAGSIDDMKSAYVAYGWKADDAVMKALADLHTQQDLEAVTVAIRTLYLPWCEDAARRLQKLSSETSAPGGVRQQGKPPDYIRSNQCVLFVDGLRFDAGKRLAARLGEAGWAIEEVPTWAALPSVTATAKAAVTPVADRIAGEAGSTEFEPSVAETGKPLSAHHLKKLLKDAGWQYLPSNELGDGEGAAWCELGDIDHEGHARGWKLAQHIDTLLSEVQRRVEDLLAAGWQEVRVVTDHGWLLLPGGLPKVELPSALAETKWGRCAAIKQGARTQEWLFPWYWNPHHDFALADGISCYKRGEDYAHGGLSLQECLTLQLVVQGGAADAAGTVQIAEINWRGLRCTVALEQEGVEATADLRKRAGDPDSSVAMAPRAFKENGTCSLVVEDEDLAGTAATLVLLDGNGRLIQQRDVRIGGES
ncbi:MAG: BREX-1 system phosphatase PglZ type B [Halorhodospira sp.]